MRVLEGKLVDSGIKVGIVAARFNEFIVSKLVAGAKDGLVRHDVSLSGSRLLREEPILIE